MMGTGVSAAVDPGIPALCSWRSCIEAVIEAAEQLEVLHPGDVAEFRRKVTKDRDLLVVAHDLIRKMSPVSLSAQPACGRQQALGQVVKLGWNVSIPTSPRCVRASRRAPASQRRFSSPGDARRALVPRRSLC